MDESSGGQCKFTFDPEVWEEETEEESPLYDDYLERGEVWHCPHEAHDGAEYCLFHLPPEKTDSKAVADAFLAQVEHEGRRSKQFVGARFGELTLDHAVLESGDNHQIDLRHARFEAETSWQSMVVRQPLTLEGAQFQASPDFTDTEFLGPVFANKASFEELARFFNTNFEDGLQAYKARFTEGDFHMASFGGPADFSEAEFDRAYFQEATFKTLVRFNYTTFDHATFSGARFGERVYFDDATVPDNMSLWKTRIGELASFENLVLSEGSCYINLAETTLPQGRLYAPDGESVVYDLGGATVGDVSLTDADPPSDLFDRYRFLNTTFEGFDFGAYREALHANDWRIHEVREVSGLDTTEQPPSDGELENTYLKAKNGANEVGDTKAAAEFFRLEMLYRREQYLSTVLDRSEDLRSRTTAIGRWIANTLLNVTAGYGERPSRVIGVSIGTIFLFTMLFATIQPSPPYDTPVGYLILSLESFITLVLGGAENIGSPWLRLLAQIEGFVGAFFIALFVFTLTRSIHR